MWWLSMHLAVIASGIFVFLAGLISTVYPLVRGRLRRVPAPARVRILKWWSVAPLPGGIAMAAMAFVPAMLVMAGIAHDHCYLHPHGYPLCLLHPPNVSDLSLVWLVPSGICGLMLMRLSHQLATLSSTSGVLRGVHAAAEYDRERDVFWVECDWPLAVCGGVLRPRIYLSAMLRQALPSREVDVIVAHERAHARNRDTIHYFVASLLSVFHMPWVRRALLDDLSMAMEQTCDNSAADIVGDPITVARTIVSVERLLRRATFPHRKALLPSFCGSNVTQRVESLLDDPRGDVELPSRFRQIAVAVWMLAVLIYPLHYFAEFVISVGV